MKKRLKQVFQKIVNNEQGATLIMVAVLMTVLLGMTALVVDVGFLQVARRNMVTAADAGALAGAQELIYDVSNVDTVARQYAVQKNSSDPDKVTVDISEDNKMVTVVTGKNVEFTFARALGFESSDVGGRAVARIGPLVDADGIVPFTIPLEAFDAGTEVTLKFGNWKDGEIGPGNYNALALGGSGANTYRDNIKYGYNGTISIGEELDTEPGNMSGPTKQGVEYRLDNDKERVTIPLYKEPAIDGQGKGTVKIIGFAVFELISVEGHGNISEVTGRFVKSIAQGDQGNENAPDYGAYGVKLVE